MANLTREERAARAAIVAKSNRVPINAANKLSFEGTDPDYHYRVVVDRPGRLQMFLKAGYEFCSEEIRVTDGGIAETTSLDSRVSLDTGGGEKGYLMRIRKEFYDEDQAAKIERIKSTERQMQRQPTRDNPYKGLTDE